MIVFKICLIKDRAEIEKLYQLEKERESKNISIKPNLFDYSKATQFRDVHVYDRQTDTIPVPKYSTNIQLECMQHLKSLLRNPYAINMINILSNRNNLDPANNVDSADLLVWICIHDITPELFLLLEEQLADNGSLGTCLQGSSHRIRQIYYAQYGMNG